MSARPLTTIALIASPGTQTALSRRLASSRPTVVLPDAGTPEITNSATLRSCHALPPFSSPPSPYGSVLAESLICEVGGRAGGRGPQHPGLAGQQGALKPEPVEHGGRGKQRLALRQVDDHRRADHVGQQQRLVGQ